MSPLWAWCSAPLPVPPAEQAAGGGIFAFPEHLPRAQRAQYGDSASQPRREPGQSTAPLRPGGKLRHGGGDTRSPPAAPRGGGDAAGPAGHQATEPSPSSAPIGRGEAGRSASCPGTAPLSKGLGADGAGTPSRAEGGSSPPPALLPSPSPRGIRPPYSSPAPSPDPFGKLPRREPAAGGFPKGGCSPLTPLPGTPPAPRRRAERVTAQG